MDYAAMSIVSAQASVMQQASMSATKNAMNVAQTQMQGLVDMLEQASPANPFQKLDIRA